MVPITTEDRLDADKWVDQLDTESALKVMLENQAEAIAALRKVLPQITEAVQALHARLVTSDTGRLVYIGAGTSARIGVQDGAELLPTFGWPDKRTAFIIAGVRRPCCSLLKMQKTMNTSHKRMLRVLPLGRVIVLLAGRQRPHALIPVQASAQRGTQDA